METIDVDGELSAALLAVIQGLGKTCSAFKNASVALPKVKRRCSNDREKFVVEREQCHR